VRADIQRIPPGRMTAVNRGTAFSRASQARQSYPWRQYAASWRTGSRMANAWPTSSAGSS
jgi:hypothetical protein